MVACCRVGVCTQGALSVAMPASDLLKEVAIISPIVWPQVNDREGTQLHPSTENWIKDLLNMDREQQTDFK